MKHDYTFFRVALFSFALFFLSSVIQAQEKRSIGGQVTEANGQPIPGASVVVKGTKVAAVTNVDGKFTLVVPEDATTLVVSFIGMKTQEVRINNTSNLKITLQSENNMMEAVIVTGYGGAQKKSSIVGAIAVVKGEDLVRSALPSVTNALTGLVPGMVTIQQTGLPGADDAKIYIRGLASFNGNNQPLVLVDGIERGINDIDPNDVESISVLKDASATAAYGVKGGNGVILITTKRGQSGKMQISTTFEQTFKQPVNKSIQENSYNTLSGRNEIYRNRANYSQVISNSILEHYRIGDEPYLYPDIDAWDYSIKPVAFESRAAINARGGTAKAKYYISIGYLHQGDLTKNIQTLYDPSFKYDRYNFRMNFDFDLSKSTKLAISSGGFVGNQSSGGLVTQGDQGSILNNLISTPPYASAYIYPAGILDQYPDPNNPEDTGDRVAGNLLSPGSIIGPIRKNFKGTTRNITDRLGTDLTLVQKLDVVTPGLSVKGLFSYNNDSYYTGGGYTYSTPTYLLRMENDKPTWIRYLGSGVDQYSVQQPFYQTGINRRSDPGKNYVYSVQFDYKRAFDKHNLGGLAFFQRRISQAGSSFQHYEENWVGRGTYDYDGKYLFDASLAISGSENFAPQNRFGYFPAFGVGWNIAKEKLVQDLIPQLNNFKIRYSYGVTGNDNTGSGRLFVSDFTNWTHSGSTYIFTTPATITGINGASKQLTFIQEGKVPNLEAQWERAIKQDLGYELGFFNNKLTFNLDFYSEKRTRILMERVAVSTMFGQTILPLNIGATKRHGYEFEAEYRGTINQVRYSVKGNYNFNENRIVDQDDPQGKPKYQQNAGRPISAIVVVPNVGYYRDRDDIANYNLGVVPGSATHLMPGADMLLDFNGDGTTSNDGVPMGYTTRPNKTFSFSSQFMFKNLDFGFMFQGSGQVNRNNGNYTNPMWFNDPATPDPYIKVKGVDDTWTPVNQDAAYAAYGGWNPGSKAIESAKYIRLKMLELGYNISARTVKVIGLSSARISLQGANLWTWAPGYKFGDPENEPQGGDYQYGLQFYPLPRRVTLGLKANF